MVSAGHIRDDFDHASRFFTNRLTQRVLEAQDLIRSGLAVCHLADEVTELVGQEALGVLGVVLRAFHRIGNVPVDAAPQVGHSHAALSALSSRLSYLGLTTLLAGLWGRCHDFVSEADGAKLLQAVLDVIQSTLFQQLTLNSHVEHGVVALRGKVGQLVRRLCVDACTAQELLYLFATVNIVLGQLTRGSALRIALVAELQNLTDRLFEVLVVANRLVDGCDATVRLVV